MTNFDSILKIRAITSDRGPYSQSYVFSSSHVWMWEFSHKEGWVPKNGCFQTVVLEKTLQCLLDYKEIKAVNPEGSQPWIFIEKNQCWSWSSSTLTTCCEELNHWKRSWCWERLKAKEKGVAEDKIIRQHHRPNECEFEETLEDSGGHRSLACCSPWGHKALDMNYWVNSNSSKSLTFPLEHAFLKENVLILTYSAVLIGSKLSISGSDSYFLLHSSFFNLPFSSDVFTWAARSSKDA